MRRLFLCFLLCLMPLRLWAGAWMPTAQAASHQTFAAMPDSVGQPSEARATHDCHETTSVSMSEAHAHLQSLADASADETDCHDGTCQLCGVCHQSAGLLAWPLLLPGFQAQPLPVSATRSHAARLSAPLIKPPIS